MATAGYYGSQKFTNESSEISECTSAFGYKGNGDELKCKIRIIMVTRLTYGVRVFNCDVSLLHAIYIAR